MISHWYDLVTYFKRLLLIHFRSPLDHLCPVILPFQHIWWLKLLMSAKAYDSEAFSICLKGGFFYCFILTRWSIAGNYYKITSALILIYKLLVQRQSQGQALGIQLHVENILIIEESRRSRVIRHMVDGQRHLTPTIPTAPEPSKDPMLRPTLPPE